MLREGGFVFVKILSDNGGGKYTISLGGQKFEATAKTQLQEGTLLRAQIQTQQGKINLVPENYTKLATPDTTNGGVYKLSTALLNQGQIQTQLAEIFATLGLPTDSISLKLLSFLQQMGLKADATVLAKCRKLAKSFPGREEEAAEIALLLSEKGIEPTEESVTSLLNTLLCNFFESDSGSSANKKNSQSSNSQTEEQLFFRLYEKNIDEIPNSTGLLTLSNHITSGKLHWIILPFILSANEINNYNQKEVSGTIRVLINLEKKNIKKIIIKAQTSNSEFYFVIYYQEGKISQLTVFIEPELSKAKRQQYENLLQQIFPYVQVKFERDYKEPIFFTENEYELVGVYTEA